VPRVRTTQSKDAPQRCRHPRPRRLGGRLRARPDGRRVSSRRIHGFTMHGFSCLPVHNAALCSRAYSNRKRVTNVCAGRCSSAPRRSARPRRRPPCAPPRFANRAILKTDLCRIPVCGTQGVCVSLRWGAACGRSPLERGETVDFGGISSCIRPHSDIFPIQLTGVARAMSDEGSRAAEAPCGARVGAGLTFECPRVHLA
jgi:hypothetical protein